MKLNMLERLRLLEVLPNEGTRLNLKIVRKLRETLSFSEAELLLVPSEYEFACAEVRTDTEGGKQPCGQSIFVSEGVTPNCELHGTPMQPTDNWHIKDVAAMLKPENEKDIHMGTEALKVASLPLQTLNDSGKLTEKFVSLYDKFFPEDE